MWSPLGQDVLVLESLSGVESLGRLYRYELDLLSEDPAIEVDRVLGDHMAVRLALRDGDSRYFTGLVASFAQVDAHGGLSRYRAVLRPWLWKLTLASDCRIFQGKTVPQIVKEVLRSHGLSDIDDRLLGRYRKLEYCVQYRETDFNFISRLMEDEGIYYYFRHEANRHALVLADSVSSHEAFPGYEQIRYDPPARGSVRHEEYIGQWSTRHEVRPTAYAHNDFDFENPKKRLLSKGRVPRDHAAAGAEIYDYPGHYGLYPEGEDYAAKRIEEIQAGCEATQGATNARGLSCGSTFELADYPRDDQCIEHLITSASYELKSEAYRSGGGAADELYACTFTAMDCRQPFRPARTTPKPVIQGPQTAIVVGQEGEEIWTDQYGRVKVQFHWDRYGKCDESSSCWIRVAHSWAGKGWGSVFIPRIGQEVIVEFLEGDPDRPIITGRVYNGCSMPPYKLPENASMSTIKSNSTKGGQGFNEIRFQDKKGEEQLFFHAEKNHDIRVKNNTYESVGAERHLTVETDQLEQVKHDRHETVGNDHFEKIAKDRHLSVGGMQAISVGGTHSLTVSGDVVEVIQGNHCHQADGSLTVKAAGVVIQSLGSLTLAAGGSSVVIDSAGVTLKGPTITLDGGFVKIASGSGSSPGGGASASTVGPADPTLPHEADQADPGLMNKTKQNDKQCGCGKYGPPSPPPFIPPPPGTTPPTTDQAWIEIELIDENNQPVPGEPYKIELPDGSVATGSLDSNGFARVDGIDPGTCQVTFPNLHKDSWQRA